MIKAIGWDGNLVVLGLSRGNCEKLLEGKPILIAPEQLDGMRQFVLLTGGETEEAITRELAHLLPKGAVEAMVSSPPTPGEEVVVTAEGVSRREAPDPDEVAARATGRAKGIDLDHYKTVAKDIGDLLKRAVGDSRVGFGLFLFSFGQQPFHIITDSG